MCVCVYCDMLACHVLCLSTVTGWYVISCVCQYDRLTYHVLCLSTVTMLVCHVM